MEDQASVYGCATCMAVLITIAVTTAVVLTIVQVCR